MKAVNLGWKLALACKGKGSELLLDSYAIERRQQVIQTALYVLRATPNPHTMKILTSKLFYNPLYKPIIKAGWYHHNSGHHSGNHFAQSGIQMGVKLNFSPVIQREETVPPDDPTCTYNPSFQAGSRLLYLELPNGQSTHSYLDTSGYTLYLIDMNFIDTAKMLAAAIQLRGMPVMTMLMPAIDVRDFEGNQKRVAQLICREKMIIARPDHVIAWRLGEGVCLDESLIDIAASKLTGFDNEGICLKEDFSYSCDASTIRSYHTWLTREFRYNQRPYSYQFPMSVPVDNVTKETAIQTAKASMMKDKGSSFTTTTKQGDERYEKRKGSENNFSFTSLTRREERKIDLSGFEAGNSDVFRATIMSKLVRVANDRKSRGEVVHNFSVGNPSLEPPQEILDEIKNLAVATEKEEQSGMFKYTHAAGLLELREFISSEISIWQGVKLSPENIIFTPGAQSAIVNVFETLLQPADHVFATIPYYPAYSGAAELWKAEIKKVKFKNESFDIDLEDLRELASSSGERFRVFVLCSPSNPCGTIMKMEKVKEICALLTEHSQKFQRDVWLVMDHTYWRMTFNDDGVPATFPLYKQSILLSSFSKDLSLAGERIGYVVVHPEAKRAVDLIRWITNNNDRLGNLSPPSFIQHVLLAIYRKYGKLPNQADIYKERVSLMHEKITSMGFRCVKPEGGFYLFARLPEGIVDDVELAHHFANAGVLVIPGEAFAAKGYIRFSALPPPTEIEAGCTLMEEVLNDMR